MSIEEIAKTISIQREQSLEDAFKMFGFTKDYLLKHKEEFLVVEQGNVRRYCHNDKALFDEVVEYKNDKLVVEIKPLT